MATKNKLKEVPMLPTLIWDKNEGKLLDNGTYSHVAYEGETRYESTLSVPGNPVYRKAKLVSNTPFQDELKFVGFSRGRSAAGGNFTNEKGQQFYMFLTDLSAAEGAWRNGVLKGTFMYVKRGRYYGVQMV